MFTQHEQHEYLTMGYELLIYLWALRKKRNALLTIFLEEQSNIIAFVRISRNIFCFLIRRGAVTDFSKRCYH